MNRKTLALVGVVLLVATAGCLGILGDDNGDNGVEEGADGPDVGDRDVDEDAENGEDANGGDDESDTNGGDDNGDDPPSVDEVDFPVGADENGVDWQTVILEHYDYMEINHESMTEEVEYENTFESFLSSEEGDIGMRESVSVTTQHNWDMMIYSQSVSEEYEDAQTQQTRDQEFYFDRQFTQEPTQYVRVVENGDEEITVNPDQDYGFSDGIALNGLRLIEELEYEFVGVDERDGETVIEYDASIEDNREQLKTPSLEEFETVETVDVTLVLSESGQIIEYDYMVEVDVTTPDGGSTESTTRVQSLQYDYYDVDDTNVEAPQWVVEEASD